MYKVLPYALVRIPSKNHHTTAVFFFGFDIFMNYAKIRQSTLGATVITFFSLRRIRDVISPCLTDTCLDKVWLTVSLRFWLSGTCDLLLF